jgi:hypothetical protein
MCPSRSLSPVKSHFIYISIKDGLISAMLDTFGITSAQITFGSVFVNMIKRDHTVRAGRHAGPTELATFLIDLYGLGFVVSRYQISRTGIQTDTTLEADKRCVYRGFSAQDVNHRPFNVYYSFSFH